MLQCLPSPTADWCFESIDIFNSQQRSSLASDELSQVVFASAGLSKVETDFSVSRVPKYMNDLRRRAADENNSVRLARFLKLCRKMEKLELHHLRLRHVVLKPTDLHNERLAQRVIEMVDLQSVRKYRLRGLKIREEDLLRLVNQQRLLELLLEAVTVIDTFRPVFDCCTSGESRIQQLDLDQPHERSILRFDNPGDIFSPSRRFPNWFIALKQTEQISSGRLVTPFISLVLRDLQQRVGGACTCGLSMDLFRRQCCPESKFERHVRAHV